MAEIHWKRPISAAFSKAADWKGGTVPGASDDAILGVAGAAYTQGCSTLIRLLCS